MSHVIHEIAMIDIDIVITTIVEIATDNMLKLFVYLIFFFFERLCALIRINNHLNTFLFLNN